MDDTAKLAERALQQLPYGGILDTPLRTAISKKITELWEAGNTDMAIAIMWILLRDNDNRGWAVGFKKSRRKKRRKKSTPKTKN